MRLTSSTAVLTKSVPPFAVAPIVAFFEGAYATAGRAKTIMARGIAANTVTITTTSNPLAIGAIVTSFGAVYIVTVPTFETSQGRSLFEVKCSFVTTRILCYIEMRSQKNVRTFYMHVSRDDVAIHLLTCSCNSSGEKNEDR